MASSEEMIKLPIEDSLWRDKIQKEISTIKLFIIQNMDKRYKDSFKKFESIYHRVLLELKNEELNIDDVKILYVSLMRSVKKIKRDIENTLKLNKTDHESFREKWKSRGMDVIPIVNEMRCNIEPKIKEFDVKAVSDYRFPVLDYTNQELCEISLEVFEYMGLHKEFNIERKMLQSLIQSICKNYNVIPYHNFSHAFSVFQMIFHCYCVSEFHNIMSKLEMFAGLLAALGHDLNHKGINNSYKIKRQSHKCLIYSEQSILEKHHTSCFFTLLKDPKSNMLTKMNENQKIQFKKVVISSILGTDMVKHQHLLAKFSKRVSATKKMNMLKEMGISDINEFTNELAINTDRFDDQKFLLKIIVHASDIGNSCLDYDYYFNWSALISQEFEDQTKKEAAHNLEVTGFLRYVDKKGWINGQIFFLRANVLPLWKQVAEFFPTLSHLTENIEKNINRLEEEKKLIS